MRQHIEEDRSYKNQEATEGEGSATIQSGEAAAIEFKGGRGAGSATMTIERKGRGYKDEGGAECGGSAPASTKRKGRCCTNQGVAGGGGSAIQREEAEAVQIKGRQRVEDRRQGRDETQRLYKSRGDRRRRIGYNTKKNVSRIQINGVTGGREL